MKGDTLQLQWQLRKRPLELWSTMSGKIGKEENAVALKDAQDALTTMTNAVPVLETLYKDEGISKDVCGKWFSLVSVISAANDMRFSIGRCELVVIEVMQVQGLRLCLQREHARKSRAHGSACTKKDASVQGPWLCLHKKETQVQSPRLCLE